MRDLTLVWLSSGSIPENDLVRTMERFSHLSEMFQPVKALLILYIISALIVSYI